MSDCARCAARSGWPRTTGTGRGPYPSLAGGNSSAQPSADVDTLSGVNADMWALETRITQAGPFSATEACVHPYPASNGFQQGAPALRGPIAALRLHQAHAELVQVVVLFRARRREDPGAGDVIEL